MTRTDLQNRVNTLIQSVPFPEEHEIWNTIWNGVRGELLDALAAGINTACEPTDTALVCEALTGHMRRSARGLTHSELQDCTSYSSKIITQALRLLLRDDRVSTTDTRRAKRYHAVPEPTDA